MFDATGSTGIPACMSRIAGVSASLPCLVDVGQVTNKKADLWQKIGFLRLSSGGRFAGADVPAREQPIVAAHLPQRTTTCQEKSGQTSEKLREKSGQTSEKLREKSGQTSEKLREKIPP